MPLSSHTTHCGSLQVYHPMSEVASQPMEEWRNSQWKKPFLEGSFMGEKEGSIPFSSTHIGSIHLGDATMDQT